MSENERLRKALRNILNSGVTDIDSRIDYIEVQVDRDDWIEAGQTLYKEPETCVWKEIDSEDQDTWPMDGEFVLIMCADGDHFAGTMHVCKFVPFWYRDGHMVPEFSMPGHGGIIASHWMSLPTAPGCRREIEVRE